MALQRGDRVQVVPREPGTNARVVARSNRFVRVEHQNPVARGQLEAVVPREAEIVLPCALEYACAIRLRDLHRPVCAAGVNEDDLVNETAHRLEAPREVTFLVLRNHAQRKGWPHARLRVAGSTPHRP